MLLYNQKHDVRRCEHVVQLYFVLLDWCAHERDVTESTLLSILASQASTSGPTPLKTGRASLKTSM